MLYYLFMTCFAKKQEPVKNMGDVTTLRAFSYLRISDRDLVRKATSNWFLPGVSPKSDSLGLLYQQKKSTKQRG